MPSAVRRADSGGPSPVAPPALGRSAISRVGARPGSPRVIALLALLAGLLAPLAGAQPDPKKADPKADPKAQPKAEPKPPPKAPEPTADEVQALANRFRAEREEALKGKFPADTLARADDLAKRAEKALQDGNRRAAARYYRDARWQVPFLPPGLPPHVVRMFGEARMRHSAGVYALAYSPDGTRLASASLDGTAKVWDLGNGREVATYRGHADQPGDPSKETNVLKVAAVAFHPKERMAASAAGSQVHLWDPETGKQLRVLAKVEKDDRPLKSLAFSPDGKSLAVGGDDGVLRVYDVATGKATFTGQPRNARLERVAFSPNGKLIAVADSGGLLGVYAPGAGNPMPLSTPVTGSGGEAFGVAFTADGGAVFTCGRDGVARLTAGPNPDGTGGGASPTTLREFKGHTGAVTDLAVTADGKTLVTGGDDRTVRVWEVTSGTQLRSFQGHTTRVVAVAVRADGRQAASASDDGAIRLWDLGTTDDQKVLTDATEPVWAVAISPDGKRAAAAGADKTIRVYDPETGKLEAALTGHTSAVTSLAFFPDGNRLASAGGDRVVRIWDVAAKKQLRELAGHESAVLAVAVSPDGKRVVSGAADRTARGWDPDGDKPLWSWSARTAVCAVAVRPGGAQVAAGAADGTLVVLDVSGPSPKEVGSQSAHVAGVAAAAYSPDGSKLATAGGNGAVRVWTLGDAGQPVQLARFDGPVKPGGGSFPLSAVAFSPDGRFVASAGADAVIRVWDVQGKAEVRGLRGHTEWATAVGFGPDARLLVSAGADKTVRVFELAPQEGLAVVGHLRAVNAVAVSPDGKTVATASTDQTVKLWDLAGGKELATLVGNTDTPLAVAFVGTGGVALGTQTQGAPPGRVRSWALNPTRSGKVLGTGEVYTLVATPDGSRVAAWTARPVTGERLMNSTYEVYDKDWNVVASLADKGRNVRAAAFSADLSWVAAGDETGTVRIWDLGTKERVGADWPIGTSFGDLGLTPDKKYLVAVDQAGLLKVGDVAKREVLGSAKAHPAGVRGLLVSPKGDTFVTLGADREVKAWSLADPKALKEVRSWALPVGVNGAAYAPDGKTVVTANADGTAFVLELP